MIPNVLIPKDAKVNPEALQSTQWRQVAELTNAPGWDVMISLFNILAEQAQSVVASNTDPNNQLALHKGLGMIYVLSVIDEFVSSAPQNASIALQSEMAASVGEEQVDPTIV